MKQILKSKEQPTSELMNLLKLATELETIEVSRKQQGTRPGIKDSDVRELIEGRISTLLQNNEHLELEIEKRKRMAEHLFRLNKAFRTLCQCNKIITHATEELALLDDICRTIVGVGGYRFAWIGFGVKDNSRTFRTVVHAGHEEGYLSTLNLTWSDTPLGQHPAATAFRTGTYSLMNNTLTEADYAPWRDKALQSGYASIISFPLVANGERLGALTIYATEPGAFARDEIELLIELADDVAHGIAVLRDHSSHRQTEEKLKLMFDSVTDGITVTDLNGVVTEANNRAVEMYGYDSKDDILGKSVFELVSTDDRDRAMVNLKNTLLEGSLAGAEYSMVKADNSTVPIEQSTSILKDPHGNPLGFITVTRDITERKRSHEYEEMNKLKTNLLSAVSHELRTPLASIKGYSTLLLDYEKRLNREKKRHSLECIDAATDNLTELIDHLLDLSRLEAGLFRLGRTPTKPERLFGDTIADARLRFPHHKIETRFIKKFPVMTLDGRRIRQVLDNLLDNAAKYSENETVITVNARRSVGELIISVCDQGRGIPADEISRIFDRMYRIEQRLSDNPSGLGLGLSLCKAIVEAHGGRIWAESKAGRGSTFYFALPITNKALGQ